MTRLSSKRESRREIEQVRSALELRRWSEADLARAAGLAHGTVRNLLCGLRCGWSTKERINVALGLEIFNRPESPGVNNPIGGHSAGTQDRKTKANSRS